MKLSILIPSLISRTEQCANLCQQLHIQLNALNYQNEMEILKDVRGSEVSIGEKRNRLLERATGSYISFFDDDDLPGPNYLKHIFEGINLKVDCCSLKGIITTDGQNKQIFEHSLKYNAWKENISPALVKYERYPNHLNCIKTEIAQLFTFPESNFGEDKAWSDALFKSGLLKSEHYIDEIIYNYLYKTHK